MPSLEQHLQARASALRPTEAQRQAAQASEKYLRKTLDEGRFGARILNSHLTGSYARDTAIVPLDDVDIVFLVDPIAWRRSALQRLFDALPDPDKVLGSFAAAIRYRYRKQGHSSRVQVQRRSVGLVMNHLAIDAVPAVQHDRKSEWLYIPDADAGKWIETAPAVHKQVASNVNGACGGKLKPLVRLLKAWNSGLPKTGRMKSFAVETIATRILARHPQRTLLSGCHAFFDYLAWQGGDENAGEWHDDCGVRLSGWSRTLPDTAGISNIVAHVSGAKVDRFLDSARVTRNAFDRTARSRAPDAGWAKHLDSRFPL